MCFLVWNLTTPVSELVGAVTDSRVQPGSDKDAAGSLLLVVFVAAGAGRAESRP